MKKHYPIVFTALTAWLALYLQAISHEGGHELVPKENTMISDGAIYVPKESQFLLKIQTALVKKQLVSQKLSTTGKVTPKPHHIAEVYSSHSGRVVSGHIPVVGQRVYKGQILAIVEELLHTTERLQVKTEQTKLEGQLQQAQVDWALAQEHVLLAEQEVHLSRQTLERLQSIENVIARKELPQAELALKKAQNSLQRAMGEQKRQQITYQQLHKTKKHYDALGLGQGKTGHRYPIVAPISGVISQGHIHQGEQVAEKDPLAEIIDASVVWVEAHLYESQLALVGEVKQANIIAEAFPDQPFHGKLITVGQRLDEKTKTIPVIFEVHNPAHLLKIGMSVQVLVDHNERREHIVLPESAIYPQNGKNFVFVAVKAEHYQQREVELGVTENRQTAILKGIQVGEKVAINNTHQIFTSSLTQKKSGHPAE